MQTFFQHTIYYMNVVLLVIAMVVFGVVFFCLFSFAPSFPSVPKRFPAQFGQEGWRAAVSTVQASGLLVGHASA